MQEVWKDIPGYEGSYQASTLGRIRSVDKQVTQKNGNSYFQKGRVLKQKITHYGYLIVNLHTSNNTQRVHRLVMLTFIGEGKIGFNSVDHLDGDKTNNALYNLQYVSHSENNMRRGYDKEWTKGKTVYVFKDGDYIASFNSSRKASIGIFGDDNNARHIRACCASGRKCKGYNFTYKNWR